MFVRYPEALARLLLSPSGSWLVASTLWASSSRPGFGEEFVTRQRAQAAGHHLGIKGRWSLGWGLGPGLRPS